MERLIIRGFFGNIDRTLPTPKPTKRGPKGLAMNFDSVMKRSPSLPKRVVACASDIFYCATGLVYYRHGCARSPSHFRLQRLLTLYAIAPPFEQSARERERERERERKH